MKIGYIIASNEVAQGRRPVGYLYREEPDGVDDSGWRVFSGDETQDYADRAENFAMYNASTILDIDPTIGAVLERPPPVAFRRGEHGEFVEVPT